MKRYIPITLVSFIALIVWLPLLMLISGSFMPIDEIKTYFGPVLLGTSGLAKWPLIPAYPTLGPYIELLLDSPEFFAMFWNSIKIVVPILIGQVCFGMPAAWAFARFEFPCKKFLFTLYIALMLMPFQVTMVPNYLVLDQMNLLNTRGALILPLVFSTFPVFIMYRFFKSIPEAMIEAAMHRVLVTDNSKFNKRSFTKIRSLKNFEIVIANEGLDEELIKKMEDEGLNIKLV